MYQANQHYTAGEPVNPSIYDNDTFEELYDKHIGSLQSGIRPGGIELLLMPRRDGTGPRGDGKRDGSGAGRGQGGGNRRNTGAGPKKGGKKGNC